MKRRIKSKIKKRDLYILLYQNIVEIKKMRRLIEISFIMPPKTEYITSP